MDVDLRRRRRPEGRVLVVGAGPVGLVSALLLRHHGVDTDIVDRNTEAVSQSRATDLHPATLERLDHYGVTGDLLDIGQMVRAAVVHCRGNVVGTIRLGRDGSPFPFALTVPQCTTEGLLQEHLAELDCKVERGVEVSGVTCTDRGADVTLTSSVGGSVAEVRSYDWVIACDGASSTVRQAIGLGFDGVTARQVSAIADVELELPFRRDEIHIVLRREGGVHVLPMPIDGYVRLLIDRWPGGVDIDPDPDVFVDHVTSRLGLDPLRPRGARWTSAFLMHRRVADRFRHRRVLLAGDAAHVCPPIGGQGLNSGVGDAATMIPALVSVMRGHVADSVLDAVAARRHVAARRNGQLAWLAATVNAPRSRLAAGIRDAAAPVGVRVTRPLITRWLAGAADR